MSVPKGEVVVAGHLCLDMIPRFPEQAPRPLGEILRPGALINMDRMVYATGGTVSNTGIALRIFGCEVVSIARVGDDATGDLILKELARYGNAEGIRVAKGEASSYSVVLAPPGVDRIFLHCPGTNDTFGPEDVDIALVKGARLFHFGYPQLMRRMFADGGVELSAILRRAKETGVTTSLDMAMPDPAAASGRADWRSVLARALPHTDVFLPSIEEAFACLRPSEYRDRKSAPRGAGPLGFLTPQDFHSLGDEILGMGCAMTALKAGEWGWYFRTGTAERIARMGRAAPASVAGWAGRELWCPAYRVSSIASATGSGDSSIAGFLTSLLRGCSLEDCLHYANTAGAHNLSGLDAVSGLKEWKQVVRDAAALSLGELPFLSGTEWRYRPEGRLWERPALG